MDIKILVKALLSDTKPLDGQTVISEIYHDEPILKTAAQILSGTPPKYLQMRRIAGSCAESFSESAIFYKQGKFMEDYTDDYEYHGEFSKYYPTYRSMNTLQLRGYFSWRTKLREGILEKAPPSFAFVYIYELLNQIGVPSPLDGFYTLKSFGEEYGKIDPVVTGYIKRWLKDYVVYYSLDKSLLDGLPEVSFDSSLLIIKHCQDYDADTVFSALASLSTYDPEKSRFYKQNSDDFKGVTRAVFISLSEHYDKLGRTDFCGKLFGPVLTDRCVMFQSAVFYEPKRHENCVYMIDDLYIHRCKNGVWSCERFLYSKKNRQIGLLLKTIDCLMRREYGFKTALKEDPVHKLYLNTIRREIDAYLEHKRKAALPIIEIDASKLQGIRQDSLETQDKLLVGEEPEESEETALLNKPSPITDSPLDAAEYRFMQHLLYGKALGSGAMISVLADAVNEKLFDLFGDTVIVFDGDKPTLLPEYIDQLKGIVTNEGA